jgi:hypothetical protein
MKLKLAKYDRDNMRRVIEGKKEPKQAKLILKNTEELKISDFNEKDRELIQDYIKALEVICND